MEHFLTSTLASVPHQLTRSTHLLPNPFLCSIESVVRISGIATYMLIRCPTLGGCALSVIPLVAVINKFFSNWLSRNARMVQDALAEANKAAQETFSCIRTVISFAAEQFELEKYVERVNRQYDLNVKQVSAPYIHCSIEAFEGFKSSLTSDSFV